MDHYADAKKKARACFKSGYLPDSHLTKLLTLFSARI
jgi:hypothetical protein